MISPVVVVGVDGSPASHDTLLWAAAEAVHRGRDLSVVHAFDWRTAGALVQVGGEYAADVQARADEIVASAVAAATAAFGGLSVRGEAVLGEAARILIHASERAELVVVGSRGHGGFADLLLGSVSQQVTTHAAGPVAVVRGRADVTKGPIVVGTDGSAGAAEALRVAFDEAMARDASLVAIRAYTRVYPSWGMDVAPYVEDREERQASERAALAKDLAPWLDKFPGVRVEQVIADASPASVLTGASSTAQLVVVGTRGHGGFAGLLLGSVGLQLLHHAACPVLVARPAGL